MSKHILLVDDDLQALESMKKILELSGFQVTTASDGQAALEQVRPGVDKKTQMFDLVITDVRMPRLGGIEFLRALSLCGEKVPVILMTAFGRVEDAVWAMKLGAVDFLTKPFKRNTLITAIEAAMKRAQARDASVSSPAKSLSGMDTLVGRSQSMTELKTMIQQVASTSASVLLQGESGTGKELVARCIHEQSARAKGRFIALNCGAFPEQLIESELFGFEKGSFTGATAAKEGLFEAANGGTLLLDEIGDMPLSLQVKLLRTLQESEVRRIGATTSKKIDVRVIAATHRDLKENVRIGTFRQDLLFRLEVIGMHIAPLRDRIEDLPDLAYHFLKSSARRHEKTVSQISSEAMELLLAHTWPGNVRELSNVIERSTVFATSDFVQPADLPPHLISLAEKMATPGPAKSFSQSTISVRVGTPLKEVEELLIRKTLEATSGDKNMTAKLLGINSRTIYRRLERDSE